MTRSSPYASPTDLPSHYVPVGTSLHSPGRQVPLHRVSSSASSTGSQPRSGDKKGSSPSFNELKHDPRAWDELFPLPASSSRADQWRAYRRSGAFFVVALFLVAVVGTAILGGDKSAVSKLPSGGFGAAHAAGAASSAAGVLTSAVTNDPKIEDDDDESAPTAQSAVEPGSCPCLNRGRSLCSFACAVADGCPSLETPVADDHSHYHLLETLSADQLRLDEPDRRVFFVGDIHGSFKQLGKLLAKIDYDAEKDLFVSVGDLVAKGPKPLEVLRQMRTLGVKAVRGNHDQPASAVLSYKSALELLTTRLSFAACLPQVIQWRSWFEKYLPTSSFTGTEEELAEALATAVSNLSLSDAQRLGPIPKEWVWEGEHFQIARRMTRLDYAYLLSLPLQIHSTSLSGWVSPALSLADCLARSLPPVPSLHTIVVHAGLLPFDPHGHKFSLDGAATADVDALGKNVELPWQKSSLTRLEAELALLTEVAPNADPWTLINMRSVLKHGEITKDGKSGTPWSDIWNRSMRECTRADDDDAAAELQKGKKGVSCYPINVIYGHAAGRGLDIKPFSAGLDSGCVYGHRLSALILGGRSSKGEKVKLGEVEGRIVSVSC